MKILIRHFLIHIFQNICRKRMQQAELLGETLMELERRHQLLLSLSYVWHV